MKKSYIFLMTAAMGLAFAACDDTSDLGVMQKNDAPTVVVADGVATENLIGTTLNLDNYVANPENPTGLINNVPVLNVAVKEALPETVTLVGTLQVAKDNTFAGAIEMPITCEAVPVAGQAAEAVDAARQYKAVVEGNLLENAFVSFYGNDPAAKTLWLRYSLIMKDGDETFAYTYQGSDWWPAYEVTVTPVNQKLDVAEAYVLNVNGTTEDMGHSDRHIYDDPNFSIIVEVPEGGLSWSISAKNNPSIAFGAVSVAAQADLAGRLSGVPAAEVIPVQIAEEGRWMISANMLLKTYTVSRAISEFFVYGESGLGQNSRSTLYTSDYQNYWGMAYCNGPVALCSVNTALNRGTVYGRGAAEGSLALVSGDMDWGAYGIQLPADTKTGLFRIDANIIKLSIEQYWVETLGLVGSINNWGNPDDDGTVTRDFALVAKKSAPKAYSVWTLKNLELAAGAEFKVRANNEWGKVNFGANAPVATETGYTLELVDNGNNITGIEAGTYDVSIDFFTQPYVMTLTKK